MVNLYREFSVTLLTTTLFLPAIVIMNSDYSYNKVLYGCLTNRDSDLAHTNKNTQKNEPIFTRSRNEISIT